MKIMSNKNDPIFMNLDKKVDGYENTIQLAVGSLSIFKSQIEQLSKGDFACVKFYIPEYQDASHGANIWLMSPFFEEGFCYAQPFELPKEFEWIHVGQWLKFAEEDLLDWYILSENGEMKGGYSLRYQRSLLLEDDKAEFDQHIGLSRFID
ncbi:DUF2314 domain-containing protein [Acinetobacter wuhouensis]|uniref:DUF2314 domain-containing protein n=2 Tax=Acinetobacter wuhouensis TaxID=1879050 RepID=A0A3G2SZI9_9GAMM|nr:DUF2314 domain-containing protein [Acinetobacter wuhouensis]